MDEELGFVEYLIHLDSTWEETETLSTLNSSMLFSYSALPVDRTDAIKVEQFPDFHCQGDANVTRRKKNIDVCGKHFKCKICFEDFSSNIKLNKHIKIHTGDKVYTCKDCEKQFNRNSNLIMLMKTHTGEKPYKCKDCEKQFNQNSILIRHMRTHTEEKPYKCKDCYKQFSEKTNLIRHMRTHTGENPYK